ncbi:TauD/TfdA family dioxygenase [Amycolatopsis sp. NPDC051045]|uniref:TauD/TfdA family dioxygenase n=1 Tax=Amycolatopsis sp. NPDC051045 TaxID=3156922 RepID=UPI00344061EF
MMRITLTEGERASIGALADRTFPDEVTEPDRLAEAAALAAARLPARLREHLTAARVVESDLTMVSGLPAVENLPPTPADWQAAAETAAGRLAGMVLLICASALADPLGWMSQQCGRLVHDVCPARGLEDGDTSASSTTSLSLHTEDAFHSARGDYVGLYCLRNPDRTGTTVVRLSVLDLPADVLRALRERRFHFRPDNSHDMPGALTPPEGQSIVFGPAGRPYLRYDPDFVFAKSGDLVAIQAMSALDEALARRVEHVVLRPGDALFLDNYQVLHGRQPFRPRYDGADRWLKRVNLVRDIRRIHVDGGASGRVVSGLW